jgi:hypothetical protein
MNFAFRSSPVSGQAKEPGVRSSRVSKVPRFVRTETML